MTRQSHWDHENDLCIGIAEEKCTAKESRRCNQMICATEVRQALNSPAPSVIIHQAGRQPINDCDPLKVEALRRFHYVQAVFDERPRFRTQETLSRIIGRIGEQIKDENSPSWTTFKRWSRIYSLVSQQLGIAMAHNRGSRNVRLAAIRTFFHWVALREPGQVDLASRVSAIPAW